jgi:hypothetical protein
LEHDIEEGEVGYESVIVGDDWSRKFFYSESAGKLVYHIYQRFFSVIKYNIRSYYEKELLNEEEK